ncbi:DUF1080 domain-containing protein [Telmatocola sphagniphila]|uniref:DUF1080 domain-containing protein n=1 Tax=Telmatocola sphagniphila TaxID=1123043 RepID=A0A8E6B7H6_9BACT|nr:family 16 glycoside hydrolase [Telmatocola sphagniphila]QVL32679.1 DUF1080 domain-containing protein [Telmatocola sphagniphila]
MSPFKSASDHPANEELAAFALGKEVSNAETIAEHVANCVRCETLLAKTPRDTFLGILKKAKAGSSLTGAPKADSNPLNTEELPLELRQQTRYTFLKKLGGGGMGIVWLAMHNLMKRKVAVKLIPPEMIGNASIRERFLQEVVSAAALEHANVVRAYSAEEFGPYMLFEMEYVDGKDLSEVVKTKGPLPVAHAINFIRQAAQGLQHGMLKSLVHRDIKPGNLMLTRAGTIKVADFGLAKFNRESEKGRGRSLTGTNAIMGTPDYMAPEQARDAKTADIRADIYSLGCTFYFLLTGRPPFDGISLADLIFKHWEDPRPDVCLLRNDVSPELSQFIQKMMASKSADRPQTPKEVIEGLVKLSKGETVQKEVTENSKIEREVLPFQDIQEESKSRSSRSLIQVTQPRRKWPVLIGVLALLLVGFGILAASGVLRVKTKDGIIVLENVPEDAEVTVDGNKLTISPREGKPIEITISGEKKHNLEVKKEGFKVFGKELEVEVGRSKTISVRLEAMQAREEANDKKESPKVGNDADWASKSSGDGFVPLFNGKDLSGWSMEYSDSKDWSIENGVLLARGTNSQRLGYLLTNKSYDNFILRLEFNLNDHAASGVVLRAVPGELLPHPQGVSIREHPVFMLEDQPGGSEITGTLHWVLASTHVRPKNSAQLTSPGNWNKLEIEVNGRTLRATINDKLVTDTSITEGVVFKDNTVPALNRKDGRIGLLKTYKEARFRNIEIKELNSPSTATDILAPLKSEWAGLGTIQRRRGQIGTSTICGSWSILNREGEQFKALWRTDSGFQATFEGKIDASGKISLEARTVSAPKMAERQAIEGSGYVTATRIDLVVEDKVNESTSRVVLKRMRNDLKDFNFLGKWKFITSPRNFQNVRTVLENGTVRDWNGTYCKWVREGGLIRVIMANGHESMVIDPDNPNQLLGVSTYDKEVKWIRN